MPDRPPIIVTKILVPKKRSGLFQRPRLLNFIHNQIQRKLILISAAAGYGKTSLLADFAHNTEIPVCWYALDAADRDPSVLVEYLVATIRHRFPQFGQRTRALFQGGQAVTGNFQPIVTTLVNEIYDTIPEYFVLVLDDYHLVADSRPVEDFIDQLLQYLPDNCHMILASRTIPRLPLLRLAAYREVAGLGNDDLRFTGQEIQGLLKREYNLDLPDAAADELAQESEGWITGILLTTQTIWRGMLENLNRVKGPPEQVFQYLATEVFAQQPKELQHFLLASSILHQMNPALCDSVLQIADSRELLEWIEKRNLFITRVEGPETWYKYHHLFQEFLQIRLREQDAREYIRLHQRAAAYFEASRNTTEAIHHYFQVEAHDEVCRRIAAAAEPLFEAGRVETLSGWIDSLPRAVLDEAPELLVTRARIHTIRGELYLASQLLRQAEGRFAALGNQMGQAKALIYQSTVSSQEGKYQDALDGCRRALELLLPLQVTPPAFRPAGAISDTIEKLTAVHKLTAAAHRNVGVSLWGIGKLEQARDELAEALAIYQQLGDSYHVANVHQELGNCLSALGNLAGAHLHYQRSLAFWEQIGNPATLANVLNSMAIELHQRGEYEKCLELFQVALERAQEAASWRFQGYILAGMGDVHRDLGDYETCRQLYSNALDLATRVEDGQLTVYSLDALGNTARLRGDWVTARGLLRQAQEESERHQSNREQGQCEISLGILCHEAGEASQALDHLQWALTFLVGSGARLEQARAHFHLARVLHASRRKNEALEHVQACLNACDAAGVDQFMVVEGQWALPMLQDAARRIEKRRLAGLVRRIEVFMSSQSARRGGVIARAEENPRQRVLEIHAFGKGAVYRDSVAVTQSDWGAAQAREMFFYILAHPDRSKEQIGAVFWPDLSLARMTSTFHATVYRIRRAAGRDCILYENERYQFNRSLNYRYDVEEFESVMARAQPLGPQSEPAAESYRQALAFYRGEYLEDIYSDWTMPLRDTLLHRYVEAAGKLAEFHAGRREYEQAAQLYRRLLEKDNLREEVHRRLMECYVLAGERARALQHYDRLVSLLDQELDSAPAPETVALFEQIQRAG
jgi:LuxR family transcriptional regulator, maltose regulon positive regulatory protein